MKGVIADDLSGAAEVGAVAWRHGLDVDLLSMGEPSEDADLVCIDTDSRSVSAEEAGRRAASAAGMLRRAGAGWIYKKVDSVLRGHVVVELEAMLRQLDRPSALIVPASPTRGRVVRDGQYWIHGKPIHETEFRFDPEYPRLSSSVVELLGGSSDVLAGRCEDTARFPSRGILLGEAGSDEDLRFWARRRSEFGLLGGAAEFFRALLQAEGLAPVKRAEAARPGGAGDRELFVCGSVSESARAFLENARLEGVPVLRLPEELPVKPNEESAADTEFITRAVSESRLHPRIVLTTPGRVVGDPAVSRMVSRRLTRVAAAILHRTGIARVYVEGGTTAALLLNSMGWVRPRIVNELAPGVVTLDVGDAHRTLLTLKPGSYAWPDAIHGAVGSGQEARGDSEMKVPTGP